MSLDEKYKPDEPATKDEQDDSDNSSASQTHLFLTEGGDPQGRNAGNNHDGEAYELYKGKGKLREALQNSKSEGPDWYTLSDSVSHILAGTKPLYEVLDEQDWDAPPAVYCSLFRDAMQFTADGIKGEPADILDLVEPSEKDLVKFVANSDDHDLDDLKEMAHTVSEKRNED